MPFSIVKLAELTCDGWNHQELPVYIPAGSGTIVSCGFQNMGNKSEFFITQMFPVSATEAYYEVTNYETTSVNWYPILVVFSASDAAANEIKATVGDVTTTELKRRPSPSAVPAS